MKDKFEKEIEEQTYILRVEQNKYKIKGISHAASRCNFLHNQAMKEAVKKERERVTKELKPVFQIKWK